MILEEFQEGIVDSAVVFHNTLNPLLFNNEQLKPLIRLALLKIAKDFVAFVDINFKVADISLIKGLSCSLLKSKGLSAL